MILELIFLLVFPLLCSYRDIRGFPSDLKGFHRSGFIIRACVAVLLMPSTLVLIYAVYFWVVFDGTINLFLKREWWHEGTTADIDKLTSGKTVFWKYVALVFAVVIVCFSYRYNYFFAYW